jgi:putative SOS response-associated peptidase YedK
MCCSALVIQNFNNLGLPFEVIVQVDLYANLFARRLAGEKIFINKAMEYPFSHCSNPDGRDKQIAENILQYHRQQIPILKEELQAQKKRLASICERLAQRQTNTALKDEQVTKSNIEKLKLRLKKHETIEYVDQDEQRIFPLSFMPMLTTNEQGEKVLLPVRYHMRPHNKSADFDSQCKGNYNAKKGKLLETPWWKNSLGKRHGIVAVKKFYEKVKPSDYAENFQLPVDTDMGKKLDLSFKPDGFEFMFLPTLWDIWRAPGRPDLFSAAIITEDAATEIARTGQPRMPIFLRQDAVEDWLSVKNKSANDLVKVLDRRESPRYSHQILKPSLL